MTLSEPNQQFLQEIVDRNILPISALSNVPPTITSMHEILGEIVPSIDTAAYLAYALQQETTFLRIPGLQIDFELLKTIPKDTLSKLVGEDIMVIPLRKTANTLWLGVGRPYPCPIQEVQQLLQTNNLGWNVLLPQEFVEQCRQIEQKTGITCS